MTDRAGNAVFIKFAIYRRALSQSTGSQGGWIVAAFAVARKFDAFFLGQEIYVAGVPGGAKRVRVGGLAPFGMSLLVAVTTIFCRGKCLRVDEFAVVCGGKRGEEGLSRSEAIAVMLGSGLLVGLPLRRLRGIVVGVRLWDACSYDETCRARGQKGSDQDAADSPGQKT
jgi:hypothetical protein